MCFNNQPKVCEGGGGGNYINNLPFSPKQNKTHFTSRIKKKANIMSYMSCLFF